MKVDCPECKKKVRVNRKGNARCSCGAHIKVIDYKTKEKK